MPAHRAVIDDEVEITIPPVASHVNVMAVVGPLAVTFADPLQEALQDKLETDVANVMEVGCVTVKVCVLKQFKLSKIETVCDPAHKPVIPAEFPGPGLQV